MQNKSVAYISIIVYAQYRAINNNQHPILVGLFMGMGHGWKNVAAEKAGAAWRARHGGWLLGSAEMTVLLARAMVFARGMRRH